jgi:hypothetical protein
MSGRRMRGVAALICAGSLAGLAALPANASKDVRYSTGPFVINCDTSDSTPQVCDPPEKLRVKVKEGTKVRIKRLRYRAAAEHCSPGRVLISLDGERIGRTDWVNAGEQATVEDLKVTLHPGRHRFAFRIKGRPEGCNVGYVGSWGGKITLKGEKAST